MLEPSLQQPRNRRILTDAVRAYIETGEPVSSRAVARRHPRRLSAATVRNVMADLEVEGYLYQPHTSAGRVPTAAAYRFYAQHAAAQAELTPQDQEWIRRELAAANSPEEVVERAGHVLAMVSGGLGIIVSPPLAQTVMVHVQFLRLLDGRVLVVLISAGGRTRDKVLRLDRTFTQEELDRTADYLTRHYSGWRLDAIRVDLQARLERERERYDQLIGNALLLCDPGVLASDASREVYVEGAAQIATAAELANPDQLRELLKAIEEKRRLVALLSECIETPEPVHIQIGLKEIAGAGEHLALISAPYAYGQRSQGSLGVLGPMRMQYERAITAVAYLAKVFGQTFAVDKPS